MRELPYGGLVVRGRSQACDACLRGSELVIFATGMCQRYEKCFYCTITPWRRKKDIVYVDELLVREDRDVLREARLIGAEGAGITGGEPTLVLDRVVHFADLLKHEFGDGFYLHLYTNSSRVDGDSLERLAGARLDELRFHAWCADDWPKIALATDFGFKVGAEMPAIPGKDWEKRLKDLAKFLDRVNADFLNLNEFEFSEANRGQLLKMGFGVRESSTVAVKGSLDSARRVLDFVERETGIMGYFCPAEAKQVQVLNRWRRRGKRIAKPYESVTEDGTLIYGLIFGDEDKLFKIKAMIEGRAGKGSVELSTEGLRTPYEILMRSRGEILRMGLNGKVVEVAPLDDRLTLSVYPMSVLMPYKRREKQS